MPGPMREVLDGATSEELVTSEGIFVLRALDVEVWSKPAQRECHQRLLAEPRAPCYGSGTGVPDFALPFRDVFDLGSRCRLF
jgi:hypothetical protein